MKLGWKSLGVLELTALPSIAREKWLAWVDETDALLVGGGDALYLSYWMRQSGLADFLPSLHEKVWVGVSGGSMVMAPCIGVEAVRWIQPDGTDRALRVVDFSDGPSTSSPRGTGGCLPPRSRAGRLSHPEQGVRIQGKARPE